MTPRLNDADLVRLRDYQDSIGLDISFQRSATPPSLPDVLPSSQAIPSAVEAECQTLWSVAYIHVSRFNITDNFLPSLKTWSGWSTSDRCDILLAQGSTLSFHRSPGRFEAT